MEPFEWLLLGAGLAVGGLLGANSKDIMRTAARAYLTVEEKTRTWSANMREDFHDAVEEARYEREQAEYEAEMEEEPLEESYELPAERKPRSRAQQETTTRAGARAQSDTAARKTPRKSATAARPNGARRSGRAARTENAPEATTREHAADQENA